MTELLNRIRQEQESFPAAQKLVAAYVLENYNQIPFLSITTLAKNIGVSDNTVVKFCIHLGYNKFTEFKKVFSEYAHSELVMFNKISESTESDDDDDGFFAQEMDEDIAAIRATLSDATNRENLPKLLEMMDKAKRIYITGGRSSGVLASLFANILRYLDLKVYDVSFGVGDYLDRLSMVEKEDLVIVLSFPRYTALVVDAIRDLHEDGIPIVLITDTGLSPAHPYSDLSFHCTMSSSYYFPNYTGCLSLISVISRAAAATRKKRAAQHIRQLEGWLLERGIFL
ncbi:MurR/RpiR family transcriptional regulator [Oscillospiraceae bacterium LTW-04]|nr:MurR/RpiR family transcriptional regulator [Oscillospiraceae bacterium MB24-C1]